ncbi:MAG: 5-bromo-4-chloroindolyl phosphate hydrolysis family protein, partial [Granulosicoccaceae bacterium]
MSLAKRYGGKARGGRPNSRGLLLYFLPLPLLLAALLRLAGGHWMLALMLAVSFGLCMVAANLSRRGMNIESQALRRKLVRRSSTVPYKFFASLVLGIGVALAAWSGAQESLITSVLYGGFSVLGYYLCYGFDPARHAPEIAAVGVTAEEVIDVLEEAEGRIDAIEASARQLKQPELRQRLRRIVAGVRELLDIIEDNPSDLRRARKFLKVYLDGAQQVVAGYARTHRLGDDANLDDNFRRVLDTIETVIEEQRSKLLEHNLDDLDVK